MTINEAISRKNLSQTDETAIRAFYMETMELWNNEAAQGYAMKAACSIGLSPAQVTALAEAMQALFDSMSIDEAAAYCREAEQESVQQANKYYMNR